MTAKQINPSDAFNNLKKSAKAFLIDVRTPEEFNFVGIVDASSFDNRIALLPWQLMPAMNINPDFVNELTKSFKLDDELYFLCRTGGRSNQAALQAIALGFQNCYNIVNGFEGDLDSSNQRGKINGWKSSNLPWRQK